MTQFLTPEEFITRVGEDEALQIAGTGYDNSLAGRSIDLAKIGRAARFADELIGGYVLARHPWLAGVLAVDVPDLLKGLSADITRYRLRDEDVNRSLMTETVHTRYRDALQVLRDIQKGFVDVVRDRLDGADLNPAEVAAGGGTDLTRISGPASRADSILEGW